MSRTIKNIELPGLRKISSGKVREMFELGEHILMVTSDRISAFDVVLPDPVPHKGRVLTQTSVFWFRKLKEELSVEHHLISSEVADFPRELQDSREILEGRSLLVKRCTPLSIECVVRGYLAGSGWKDYQRTGKVCGIKLPEGLQESQELSEPIFTPATKAQSGHDENISFQRASEIVGRETAERVRELSLSIYKWARQFALERGIIICDTKFEFGKHGSDLILIDEVLTPDSSRFWPASEYRPGRSQPSFDKQFMRDYLETLDWDKTPPGPELPTHIIEATSRRYLEAYRRLTGQDLL